MRRVAVPQIPDPDTMPFGKFRGEKLASIGRGYLQFVLGFDNLDADLAAAIRAALAEKGLAFGKSKNKPLSEVSRHYLEWLLANIDLHDPWPSLIKEELNR